MTVEHLLPSGPPIASPRHPWAMAGSRHCPLFRSPPSPRLFATLLLAMAVTGRAAVDLLAGLEKTYADTGLVTSIRLEVKGVQAPVHMLVAGPPDSEKHVLLLHGAAFSSQTWQLTGTIDAFAMAGFRVIAVDLPGYAEAKSGSMKQSTEERREFIPRLLAALNWKSNVLVVAASMGGSYGSPFVLSHPEQVSGYVSVSAMLDTVDGRAPGLGLAASLPTLLVWGEMDAPASPKAREQEALFRAATKVVIPNAPHPAYLKEPALFNTLLLSFAGSHVSLPANSPDWVALPSTQRAKW